MFVLPRSTGPGGGAARSRGRRTGERSSRGSASRQSSAAPLRRRDRSAATDGRRGSRRDRRGQHVRGRVVRRLRRHPRRARRLPVAPAGRTRPARRDRRRRSPACRSPSRTSSASRACRRPPARGSSRATSARTRRPRSQHCSPPAPRPRQDEHGRVRDGLLERELRLRRRPQPLGPRRGSPAARRAAPPPPSPAGLAPCALGTDTGGSIRQPAALCGVVGIKPTYGAVSRYGMIAFASSLDQCGPLTRDVARRGAAARAPWRAATRCDSTSIGIAGAVARPRARTSSGLRIGVPRGARSDAEGIEPGVARGLRARRCALIESSAPRSPRPTLPTRRHGIAAYYVIAPAEASANLARYDGVRYGLARRRPTTSTTCTSDPRARASAPR